MGTLEEQRHVDWRRDHLQPETRLFSRYKLAISCMKEELRIEIDRGRFFKEMDKLFREAKTCSISPFEEKMKSRRKKRKAAEVTTEHGTGRGVGRSDRGRGGGRGDGGRSGGRGDGGRGGGRGDKGRGGGRSDGGHGGGCSDGGCGGGRGGSFIKGSCM